MYKHVILVILLLSITLSAQSQTPTKADNTGSISDQFDYLIDKSNNHKEYKVVRQAWLFQLKKSVADSIKGSKIDLLKSYSTINSQLSTIDSLTIKLNKSEIKVDELSSEKQSINLLGIAFNKGTFKALLFSIIGILAILLMVFITKFKQSNTITKQAKKDLKELEEEFEEHRKKALEREQKAMRKLQDELNKNKKD